ncbi:peptidyl-glycine alpha-amidating monooxygenase-like [Liolophura sinensis]|uniref:peptidyl-glycine alpha-amidating monooxygenase-like n=1 Tax=Liolophura sinensis TaxID=3198878 RepID=UPI00315856D6
MFIYTFLISVCIFGAISQTTQAAPSNERLDDDQYDINITLSHQVLKENPKLWQVCTGVKMERAEEYIVAFRAIYQKGIVHHLSAHVCGAPYSDGPYWDCTLHDHICADMGSWYPIDEWGRGANDWILPPDTGVVIGGRYGGKYIVLQVHRKDDFANYIETATVPVSGMTLTVQRSRPQYEVGQLVLGNYGKLPAGVENYTTDSSCPWTRPQPIRLLAYSLHAHNLGKCVSGYLIKDGKWIEIGRGNPAYPEYRFSVWPRNMYVNTGDIMASRCLYSNPGDKEVKFGYQHEDEMCNVYLHYAFPYGLDQSYRHMDCGQDAETYHWEDHFRDIPADSTRPDGNTDQARAGLFRSADY